MEFKLEIDCDNAAFEGDALLDEVTRILCVVAKHVHEGNLEGKVRDINGNRVGSFKFDM